MLWDYQTTALSPHGHPMQTVRQDLVRNGLPTAAELNGLRHGDRARYAGLVICRQRPATASGVTFLSMEDETGFVNVVVWPKIFERQAVLVKTTAFLGVTGRIESHSGVVHLVADHVWDPGRTLDGRPTPAPVTSRDFH